MGIENRDYYREEEAGGVWEHRPSGTGWSAVTWIIVINVVCFIAQMVLGPRFQELFMLWPDPDHPFAVWSVKTGAVWQLLTYAFLHDPSNVLHILFNMYVLHMSGKDLEMRRGSREFVAFYLLAAVVSGLAVFAWDLVMGVGSPALGASGAVSAVLMVFAFTYPHARVYLFGVLPMSMLTFAGLIILFDSLPMLAQLLQANYSDSIAHSAHLGGIVLGILYQRNNWRILGLLPGGGARGLTGWMRRKPPLRVHRPPESDAHFDARVDALLDKVARQGEGSLTPDERSLLMEASRRARDRKPH